LTAPIAPVYFLTMAHKRLQHAEFVKAVKDGLTCEAARDENILLSKAFAADVREIGDADARTSTWIISTAARDRMGDTIAVDGWDLANFRKGGSILYGHNREFTDGLPIGKPLAVWPEKNALHLTMQHTSHEENPLGAQVFALVRGGFLRSNSVGFRPTEWDFSDPDDMFSGIDFKKQELLEDSIVPVPANPEALLQTVGKSMDLSPLRAWHQMALDGEVPTLGVSRKAIHESLKALTGNPVAVSAGAVGAAAEAASAEVAADAAATEAAVPSTPADQAELQRLALVQLATPTPESAAALKALGIEVHSCDCARAPVPEPSAEPPAAEPPVKELSVEDCAARVIEMLGDASKIAEGEAKEQIVAALAALVKAPAPIADGADTDGPDYIELAPQAADPPADDGEDFIEIADAAEFRATLETSIAKHLTALTGRTA